MQIYLPIAEMSVNALVIIALGGLVGFLSGIFGVGGGFLTTPLLIFYGIPPSIAVASAATQITGASLSGTLTHWRRKNVDLRMGAVLVVGGLLGSVLGAQIFQHLQQWGQIDFIIALLYTLLLGSVGLLMLLESLRTLARNRKGDHFVAPPGQSNWLHRLPWRMKFKRSSLTISPLAPLMLGFIVGILTAVMGIGGGFLLIPAMIYLLGMSASVVVGTSLFQIIFTTAAVTILHALQTQSVDIVLAVLLLLGSVVGARLGAGAAQKLKAEQLRALLGLLVVLVALRLGIQLTVEPSELFSLSERL